LLDGDIDLEINLPVGDPGPNTASTDGAIGGTLTTADPNTSITLVAWFTDSNGNDLPPPLTPGIVTPPTDPPSWLVGVTWPDTAGDYIFTIQGTFIVVGTTSYCVTVITVSAPFTVTP
jgi:hypothetical protein